jgi:hypothetical protein
LNREVDELDYFSKSFLGNNFIAGTSLKGTRPFLIITFLSLGLGMVWDGHLEER